MDTLFVDDIGSVSGSASLHDVEGGVVEGDEGEAPGQVLLHEVPGGGRAGPDHLLLDGVHAGRGLLGDES